MSVTIEEICSKVRARRSIYNMDGEPIELNNQQRLVVRAVCLHGLTIKQYARDIHASPVSLKHVYDAVRLLAGCKNQGQLGAWAAKQGLL